MSLIMRRLVSLSADGTGLLDRGFVLLFLWKMFIFNVVSYYIGGYGTSIE